MFWVVSVGYPVPVLFLSHQQIPTNHVLMCYGECLDSWAVDGCFAALAAGEELGLGERLPSNGARRSLLCRGEGTQLGDSQRRCVLVSVFSLSRGHRVLV